MAVTHRTIVLYPATAKTSTFNTSDLPIGHEYTAVNIWVKTTSSSGTSPTLDVKVQRAVRAPAGTESALRDTAGSYEYQDMAAFTQITGNIERTMGIVGSGNADYQVTAGTLAAGTIKSGPIPAAMRCRCVIAGTNPSFTIQIVVELIP